MNWPQFKHPVSHMCLAGAVVASWCLTQEVAGSSPFTVMINILSLNSAKTFRKKLHCEQILFLVVILLMDGCG